MSIRVECGECPVTGRITYALYDGELPIVSASIYLRHLESNLYRETNTLASCAYALKRFFEFLKRDGTQFWNITQANIKQYKRFYLNKRGRNGECQIKRITARQYLIAVKGLVGYWRGLREDDPLFTDYVSELDGVRKRRKRKGVLAHISWESRVPSNLWYIKIPKEEEHTKERYKGLSRESSQRVMHALNQVVHRTDIETLLYYRDRAIWTFLLMSCLRKGELVRLRLEDCDQRSGTIYLRDRPEDRWLGELKTGPGEIFVTTSNPYWRYLDSWLLEGRWIAEKKWRAKGHEDHGLLFCNHDGGPLTQPAVDHLFARLKSECKFGRRTLFYPHITRHTMACLMLNNGVQLTEVQRHLRHKSIESTRVYAKVSAQNHRAALTRFWASCEVF
jgi:site-specific recombinase XerD